MKVACAECGHDKLNHMVGKPNPCNFFRCTCKQFVPPSDSLFPKEPK